MLSSFVAGAAVADRIKFHVLPICLYYEPVSLPSDTRVAWLLLGKSNTIKASKQEKKMLLSDFFNGYQLHQYAQAVSKTQANIVVLFLRNTVSKTTPL